MPTPIILKDVTRPSYPAIIAAQLAKMKPGEAIIVQEWAAEDSNLSLSGLWRYIPKENRDIRNIVGFSHPVRLLVCHAPSKSPRPPKKR